MTKEEFLQLVGDHEFFSSGHFKVLTWEVYPDPCIDNTFIFRSVVDKDGKEFYAVFTFQYDEDIAFILDMGLSRAVYRLKQEG